MYRIEKHLKKLRLELERRLLVAAVNQYGPRDATWTISEFVFDERGPEVVAVEAKKTVTFYLSREAIKPGNYDQALFQIAHEAIHLLNPAPGRDAPMFEEGLAVHFSLIAPMFTDRSYAGRARDTLNDNYRDALVLAKKALPLIGGSEGVKALRRLEPSFRKWTSNFWTANTGIPQDLAEALIARREMRL